MLNQKPNLKDVRKAIAAISGINAAALRCASDDLRELLGDAEWEALVDAFDAATNALDASVDDILRAMHAK